MMHVSRKKHLKEFIYQELLEQGLTSRQLTHIIQRSDNITNTMKRKSNAKFLAMILRSPIFYVCGYNKQRRIWKAIRKDVLIYCLTRWWNENGGPLQ
jgi:hypothetical protein